MTVHKRIFISGVGFDENGPTFVRFGLQRYDDEDGASEVKTHATPIQNGLSDDQVAAENHARALNGVPPMTPEEEANARRYIPTVEHMLVVNEHLERMGWPKATLEQIAEVEAYRKLFRTPTAQLADLMGAAGMQAVQDSFNHLTAMTEAQNVAAERQAKIDELTVERDALKEERDSLTDQVATLGDSLANAEAQITALQTKVDENGVPQEVAMNRAMKALAMEGLLEQVEAAVAAAPGTEGDMLRIDWARAQGIQRQSPFVIALAQGLGWSDEKVDNLFKLAATLP